MAASVELVVADEITGIRALRPALRQGQVDITRDAEPDEADEDRAGGAAGGDPGR